MLMNRLTKLKCIKMYPRSTTKMSAESAFYRLSACLHSTSGICTW